MTNKQKLEILELLEDVLNEGRYYPDEGDNSMDKLKDGIEKVRKEIHGDED